MSPEVDCMCLGSKGVPVLLSVFLSVHLSNVGLEFLDPTESRVPLDDVVRVTINEKFLL